MRNVVSKKYFRYKEMNSFKYIFIALVLTSACGSPGEKEKQIREEERTPAYSSEQDSVQFKDSIPIIDDTVQQDSV